MKKISLMQISSAVSAQRVLNEYQSLMGGRCLCWSDDKREHENTFDRN